MATVLTVTVALPLLTMLVAATAEPTYADGTRVPRYKRTVHGNLLALVGKSY